MDSQTQIREGLIKSFEVRTMRSDIAKLGGDWKSKKRIPLTKKPAQKKVSPPKAPISAKVITPAPSTETSLPAQGATIQTQDAKSIGDRAIERLAKLKQEEEEKKLALLEVERLQKERLELEKEKQEIARQDAAKAEQIKLVEEKKKAQEMAEINAAKEQELMIAREKEAERRKLLEAKLQKEREVVELKQEIISLDKELQTLEEEKRPFEEERNIFLEKERQLTKNIEEIIERERTVEQEQKNVEEMEKLMDTDEEKRLAEERRWAMEEKRRKIEKERWEWEEELNKVKDQVREIELKYQKIFSREKEIEAKKKAVLQRQEAIQVEQERETLEKRLQEIKNRALPFEKERALLLENQKQIKSRLDEISLQEIDIEKEKSLIEEQENAAQNATDKKAAEIKRWAVEEKRRRIEKEKWNLEDESKKISKDMEKAQTTYQKLLNEEIELERKLGLRKEISSNIKEEKFSPEFVIKPSQKENNIKIEEKEKPLETKQDKKTDLEKFMEQVRKETEERRRTKQVQAESITPRSSAPEPPRDYSSQVPVSPKISTPIPTPAPSQRPEIKEPTTAREEKTDIQKAIARLRQEAKERKNQTVNIQNSNESKKFYEIQTPQDANSFEPRSFQAPPMPNLQDTEESLKEQESEIKKKLAEIQAEEERERQKFLGRIQENAMQEPTSNQTEEELSAPEIIRPIAARQSGGNKIFTRILATLLVLAIVAGVGFGIYYMIFLRVPPEPEIVMQYCKKEDKQIPATEWTEARCQPLTEIQVPVPPFTPNRIENIEITTPNELKVYLSQILEGNIEPKIFQRIIIKNINQSIWRVVYLQEFFSIMGAKMPEELYSKLNPEFHFFLWWQEQNNNTQINQTSQDQNQQDVKIKEPRFVIIAQITDQTGVPGILRFWEDTMEKDTENLFRFFGKTSPAMQNYFNNLNYNVNVRCQTYALNDLGSCYAIKGNYFIFSSSLDSMKAAIDRLQ